VMIVLLGLELVTGNFALIPLAVRERKTTLGALATNWSWVFVGNLLGSLFYALLFVLTLAPESEMAKQLIAVSEAKTLGYAHLGARHPHRGRRRALRMGCYPVVLELEGRQCLVVGGGAVAERKVEALLEAGARVTVISPTLTPHLASWAHDGKIHLVARAWERGDLAGHALVFVATDDGAVNAEVASEGRRWGVWVNAADDPEHCDFILPSVLRRGALTVA